MLPRPSERRHRLQAEKELQITSFLNLMVILIPFLLVTAVFSRLAVLEISLPTPAASQDLAPPAQKLGLAILIFQDSIEVVAGGKKVATVPRSERQDDALTLLSETLKNLKKQFPQDEGASVLSRPEISYQTLIQVMDLTREAGFPEISIGEARSP